jgi:general secretion pathway protein A
MLCDMYVQHFGLEHDPFSIAPDPRFLYLSERHREALAHLLYGLEAGGGFVLLTGDIGAGKTTVCRCFLEQVPPTCAVAYIFNPKLTVVELLAEVCQEFGIPAPASAAGGAAPVTVKGWLDPLNQFLLASHAAGRNSVLVIDEAQQLSPEVLEQLRLLTNLETSERKLLQIILIGQPELREMLAQPGLEQLAQRVIARYHLGPLDEAETGRYLVHRLEVAGLRGVSPIGPGLVRSIHHHSKGVPRRINLLCDRALLGAYSRGLAVVDRSTLAQAMREIPAGTTAIRGGAGVAASGWRWGLGGVVVSGLVALAWWAGQAGWRPPGTVAQPLSDTRPSAVPEAPIPARASAPLRSTDSVVAPPAVTPIDVSALPRIDDRAALAALIEPLGSEAAAQRALATRWGVTLADGPPCASAMRAGLACYDAVGGLPLLRTLDRPGVLRLRAGATVAPRWVPLLGLGEKVAVIDIGGQLHQLPLPLLAEAWRGEYTTLWRRPDAHPGGVPMTVPPALAAWLDARLPASRSGGAGTVEARLMAFQLEQGLQADGLPGPMTMMALNRRLGIDEPRLPGTQP